MSERRLVRVVVVAELAPDADEASVSSKVWETLLFQSPEIGIEEIHDVAVLDYE